MPNENKKILGTKMLFLEKAVWKKGQEIISVLLIDEHGRRQRGPHIYLTYEKDEESEKYRAVFTASDSKGNELLPPTKKLYDLKKQLIEMEPELLRDLKERGRDKTDGRESGLVRD